MARRLATIVSRIFEPVVVFFVITSIAALRSLPSEKLLPFFLFLMLLIGLPIGFMILALKQKWISNWDINKRKERMLPFALLLPFAFFTLWLVSLFQSPMMTDVFALAVIWFIGFFLITLFFKISGHAAMAAFGTGVIVSWFGWGYWPILLVVPLVAWARVVRRDHTVAQVIVGAIYSWALLVVFDYLMIG